MDRMFLRRFERKKNGKPHTYWALVESYRTPRGSRQRVVAYLGELERSEQNGWAKLGAHLEGEQAARRRSADRRRKELAMHDRFVQRFEAKLQRLAAATQSGRLKDEAIAHQRLGRLRERYWRASGAFEVTIRRLTPPRGQQQLEIAWQRAMRWTDWATLSDGCYLLRTNLTGVDAATLWRRYIQLTEAEWAFRICKDELSIRPIWHHKEDRVQAHILVCFLAYVLWKTLGGWMERGGLGSAPRTLVEEMAKIKSGDVVLPACSPRGGPARHVRLRCVTEPDDSQRVLLKRLGLDLPRRLRRVDELPLH